MSVFSTVLHHVEWATDIQLWGCVKRYFHERCIFTNDVQKWVKHARKGIITVIVIRLRKNTRANGRDVRGTENAVASKY